MLDLGYFSKKRDWVRKNLGTPKNREGINTYDTYYNSTTNIITGIKDNERNTFYKFNQEDIIQFINMLNIKETHTTEFLQSIEQTFKQYIDREIEYHQTITELENENTKLKKELKKYKNRRLIGVNYD